MKTRSRDKAPGGRGATTGGVESKKRGEGSREKEIGGGTEKASGERETINRGNRETDESKGEMVETKRSGSTGGRHTSVAKELAKEGKFRTVGVSSI